MAITKRKWSAWLRTVPTVVFKSQVTEWRWRGWLLARKVIYEDWDGSKGTSWFEHGSNLISMFDVPRGCLEVVKERPV